MFLSEGAALQTDSSVSDAFRLKQGFYYESGAETEPTLCKYRSIRTENSTISCFNVTPTK